MTNRRIDVTLGINADVTQAKKHLKELQTTLSTISNNQISINMDDQLRAASTEATKLKAILATATTQNGSLDLTKFSESLKQGGTNLTALKNNLQQLGPNGAKAFQQLTMSIQAAQTPVKKTNALINQMWTSLKNTAKWQISSSLLHGFVESLQQAMGYAKELNKNLNDIRIVSGQSAAQMEAFTKQANAAAKALSTSTNEYVKASLIYYQQGLSAKEIEERTQATIKMANATRQAAQTVSDQMTAIWNNFDNGSKSLEYYADVITALGAATASSSNEIAQGLEKFSAVAETVGLSYEYATSALATVTAETRQSADVVGTAFKTLFSRMQGLKLGETLDDGTTLNKYSAGLASVGINIKNSNGELKQMDAILDEMGNKWNQLNKDQQVALAQTVGGIRQYNQLISLMDNWDTFKINLEIAESSEGTLERQQSIYEESWEASSKRVKASLENLFNNVIDDDFFIGFNNGLEDAIDMVSMLVKSLGGVSGVLTTIGMLVTRVFSTQMAQGINNLVGKSSYKTMVEEQNRLREQARIQNSELAQQMKSSGTMQGSMQAYSFKDQARDLELYYDKAKGLNEVDQAHIKILMDKKNQLREILEIQGKTIDDSNKRLATYKNDFSGLAFGKGNQVTNYINKQMHAKNSETLITDLDQNFLKNGEIKANSLKNLLASIRAEVKITGESMSQTYGTGVANNLKNMGIALQKAEEAAKKADMTLEEYFKAPEGQGALTAIQKLYGAIKQKSADYATDAQNMINNTELISAVMKKFGISEEEARGRLEAFTNEINEQSTENQELIAKIRELLGVQEQMNGVFGRGSDALKKYDPGLAFTSATSAMMGLASAMQAVKGAWEAIKNPDATPFEKITSVMMSLSMVAMSLTNVWSQGAKFIEQMAILGAKDTAVTVTNSVAKKANTKAVKENNRARGKNKGKVKSNIESTKKDTKETNKDTINNSKNAWKGIGKTAKKYAGVAVAAIIVAASVWAFKELDKAYRADEIAAQKAQENANKLAEAYENTKSKYDEFKNSMTSYTEGVDALKELEKGTVEYTEKLMEANEQALQLIKNTKDLEYTINEDGLIEITEENLEKARRAELNEVINAQAASFSAQQQANEARYKADVTDFNRNKIKGTDEWTIDDTINTGKGAAAGAIVGTGAVVGASLLGAAGAGAAAGSVVPVVGTIIGAVVGLLVGAIGTAVATGIADADQTEKEKAAIDQLSNIKDDQTYTKVMAAFAQAGDDNQVTAQELSSLKNQLEYLNIDINDDKLLQELALNSDSLQELLESNRENIKQTELQNKLIAKQLIANDPTLADSKWAESLGENFGADIGKEAKERIRQQLKDSGFGKEGVSKASGANAQAKEYFERYAEAAGLTGAQLVDTKGTDNNRIFEYLDSSGERIEVTLEQMIEAIVSGEGNAEIIAEMKKVNSYLSEVEKKSPAAAQFAADKSFENVKQSDLQQMLMGYDADNKINKEEAEKILKEWYGDENGELSPETLKLNGWESIEEAINNVINEYDNLNVKMQEITKNMADFPKSLYNELESSKELQDLPVAIKDLIGSQINQAYIVSGEQGAKVLADLYKGLNAEDAQKFSTVLSSINWSSEELNATSFGESLKQAGFSIELTDDALISIINTLSPKNLKNLDYFKNKISELLSLKTLNQGDTISKEQYSTLSDNLRGYFTVMLDGSYQLTESALAFQEAVKNEITQQAKDTYQTANRKTQVQAQGRNQLQQIFSEEGNGIWDLAEQRVDIITRDATGKIVGELSRGAIDRNDNEVGENISKTDPWLNLSDSIGIDFLQTLAEGTYNIYDVNKIGSKYKTIDTTTYYGEQKSTTAQHNFDTYAEAISHLTNFENSSMGGDVRTSEIVRGEEKIIEKNAGQIITAAGTQPKDQSFTSLEDNERYDVNDAPAYVAEIQRRMIYEKETVQAALDVLQEVATDNMDDQAQLQTIENKLAEDIELTQEDIDFIQQSWKEHEAEIDEYMRTDYIAKAQAIANALALEAGSVSELNDLLEDGAINTEAYFGAYETVKEAEIGLDPKEVADYTKHLKNLAKDSDKLADSMETDTEAAEGLARTTLRLNRGLESLADNFDDWYDTLLDGKVETKEYSEALEGVRESLADVLDVSKDSISTEFIQDTKNLDLLKKAANGSEQALKDLRAAAAKDIITNIIVNNGIEGEQKDAILTQWNEFAANFKDLELGVRLSTTGTAQDFETLMGMYDQLVTASGMTATEASAALSAIGVTPVYEQKKVPINTFVPEYKTTTYTSEGPPVTIDGVTYKTTETFTRTTPLTPTEIDGFITAGAISTDGTAPEVIGSESEAPPPTPPSPGETKTVSTGKVVDFITTGGAGTNTNGDLADDVEVESGGGGSTGDDDKDKEEFDTQDLDNYTKAIQKQSAAYANNEAAARKLAKAHMTIERGIETLQSNWEDWSEILKSGSLLDQAKIFDEVSSAMQDVLNISADDYALLPDDFVTKNLDLIEQVKNGSMEALGQLRAEAGKEILLNITGDASLDGELQDLHNTLLAYQKDLPDLNMEAKIDDENFLKVCDSIIAKAGMTKDEAEAYFASMGYDVELEKADATTTSESTVEYMKFKEYIGGVPQFEKATVKLKNTSQTSGWAVKAITPSGEFGGNVDLNSTSFNTTDTGGGNNSPSYTTKQNADDYIERYYLVDKAINRVNYSLSIMNKYLDQAWGPERVIQLQKINKVLGQKLGLLSQKDADILLFYDKIDKPNAEFWNFDMNDMGFADNYYSNMIEIFDTWNPNMIDPEKVLDSTTGEDSGNKISLEEYMSRSTEAIEQAGETFELHLTTMEEYTDTQLEILSNNAEILNTIYETEQNVLDKFEELANLYLDSLESSNLYVMIEELAKVVSTQNSPFNSLYDILDERYGSMTKYYDELYEGFVEAPEGEKTLSLSGFISGLDTVWAGGTSILDGLEEYQNKILQMFQNFMKEAIDNYEDLIAQTEDLDKGLEHYENMLGLLGISDIYGISNDFLAANSKNLVSIINADKKAAKELTDYKISLQKKLDEETDEALKETYREEIELTDEALETINDRVYSNTEKLFEKLQTILNKNLDIAKKEIEETFSGADYFSLDNVIENLEKINDLEEMHLTKTNQLYNIEKITREATLKMSETDSAYAKEKYTNFISYMKTLKESSKISQFDLDIAQKHFELIQAQIALEEAQNAKNVVRLTRGAEGSWGYVYSANEDNIYEAENNLAQKENDLYNLAREQFRQYQNEKREIQSQATEEIDELNKKLSSNEITEDEWDKEFVRIKAYYKEKYSIVEDNEKKAKQVYEKYKLPIEEIFEDETLTSESFGEELSKYGEKSKNAYDDYQSNAQKAADAIGGEFSDLAENVGKSVDEIIDKINGPNGSLTKALTDTETAASNLVESIIGENGALSGLQEVSSNSLLFLDMHSKGFREVSAKIEEITSFLLTVAGIYGEYYEDINSMDPWLLSPGKAGVEVDVDLNIDVNVNGETTEVKVETTEVKVGTTTNTNDKTGTTTNVNDTVSGSEESSTSQTESVKVENDAEEPVTEDTVTVNGDVMTSKNGKGGFTYDPETGTVSVTPETMIKLGIRPGNFEEINYTDSSNETDPNKRTVYGFDVGDARREVDLTDVHGINRGYAFQPVYNEELDEVNVDDLELDDFSEQVHSMVANGEDLDYETLYDNDANHPFNPGVFLYELYTGLKEHVGGSTYFLDMHFPTTDDMIVGIMQHFGYLPTSVDTMADFWKYISYFASPSSDDSDIYNSDLFEEIKEAGATQHYNGITEAEKWATQWAWLTDPETYDPNISMGGMDISRYQLYNFYYNHNKYGSYNGGIPADKLRIRFPDGRTYLITDIAANKEAFQEVYGKEIIEYWANLLKAYEVGKKYRPDGTWYYDTQVPGGQIPGEVWEENPGGRIFQINGDYITMISNTGGPGYLGYTVDHYKFNKDTQLWEKDKDKPSETIYYGGEEPVGLNTGGYTGEWGSEGKLAVLHEKELVLNQGDTENFLASLGILGTIIESIDKNAMVSAEGIKNSGIITDSFNSITNNIQQSITIQADFPNVVSYDEIELAFTNLANKASQYINRK